MRRNCERPGCAEAAAVAYGMIPEDLLVWIEAIDPASFAEVSGGVLCRRHADGMSVPRGWSIDDRREPIPRLFRVASASPSGASRAPAPRPRIRRSRDDTVELPFPPVPHAERDARWTPEFDTSDDLGGLLHANGPLLSRAFGGPRRREI